MPDHTDQESLLPAPRSQKLATAVMLLGIILPLMLPLPLALGYFLWINPIVRQHELQCLSFDCPARTSWDRLTWLYFLGPELLIAVAAILLGVMGLVRSHRHPTSPENAALLKTSLISGLVWAVLLGWLLAMGWTAFAGTLL